MSISGMKSLRLIALLLVISTAASADLLRPPVAGQAATKPRNPGAPGSNVQCEIYTDQQQVVHLRGRDDLEVMSCLGFAHGRDRGWQMDFLRRTAEGRKAEVYGFSAFKQDFAMRIFGFSGRAEKIWDEMSPKARERLSAYARGVNQAFAELERNPSYEMEKFGLSKLDPWTPIHSIEFLLLQSFDQTRKSFEYEVEENTRLKVMGDRSRGLFVEDGLPWETTVLKPGEYQKSMSPKKDQTPEAPVRAAHVDLSGYRELLASLPDLTGIAGGSNSWIVSAKRSASGKALFANDPHLSLKHPPFWYWTHIEGGPVDAIGASLPGVPVIASGANRHMAWGLTNSYLDCADLAYIPESELKNTYSDRPLIWFKWAGIRWPFKFKSFQRTEKGWPILPLDAPKGYRLVMRWSGFELKAKDIEAFLDLFEMKTVEEADRIFSAVGLPSWNYVFADDRGQIGYRAIGKIIKHETPPVYGISKRSLSEFEKIEFLSTEEMPHALKPERGFVATANNRHWPMDSALHGGRAYSKSFRAFRIEELLTATPKHDRASLAKIQCDVQAVDARFLLPELLRLVDHGKDTGPAIQGAVELLKSWDRFATTDSKATSLYRMWLDHLMSENGLNEIGLYRTLRQDHAALSTSANQTLHATLEWFTKHSPGGMIPAWSELHKNHFEHLAGGEYFRAKPISTPGDTQSVNPGTMDWRGDYYEHTNGASQRLIVEMTSPPRVWAILPGPNPDEAVEGRDLSEKGSPWRRWADCEQDRREFPLDWTKVKPAHVVF